MSDYLFDRTGHDPDVEALEAALAPLRFDRSPPEGPAGADNVVALRPAQPSRGAAVSRWLAPRIPLAAALLVGLAAATIAYVTIRQAQADAARAWELIPVTVAAVDLPAGAALTPEVLTQRLVPAQFVTGSVIRAKDTPQVLLQRLRVPLQAGDAVLVSQLQEPGGDRLATKVPVRQRAVAVEARGVAHGDGVVQPADRVDFIGTFRDPASGRPIVVTLLEDVAVLATGALRTPVKGPAASVAVLVEPREAELLALAQEAGALNVTLRGAADAHGNDVERGTQLEELLANERSRELERRRRDSIDVIRRLHDRR